MTSHELFRAGRLAEAVQAALQEVKHAPTDAAARGFLSELACFAGDLERADRQLETIVQQDSQAAVGISMVRQLIRAEQARQQFFGAGRVPEFLDQPTESMRIRLQASIAIRNGELVEACQLLTQAEGLRQPTSGSCDGEPFDDFRDLDDLTSDLMEVLTSTGRYFWIPLARIESIEFRPPERPRDLYWRQAGMTVHGGPGGEVFLPVLYPGSHAADTEQLQLGRASDWRGDGQSEPVRGIGQRVFLVGDNDRSIMEIETLTFDQPS